MTALESLRGLIVIEEVQRHPDLFPILRVLLDRKSVRSSETLAGRLAIAEMGGFTLEELESPDPDRLWFYPGSTRYGLRPEVEVMSLAQCVADLA
jgi:hypothetical protein